MKWRSLLAAAGVALVSASAAQAATIQLVASADGTVSDELSADGSMIKDGIFETVDATGEFLDIRYNRFEWTTHGIFEFDLAMLPKHAVITKADFIFRIFATGSQPALIDFFAATGDGQITLNDATDVAAGIGRITLPTGLPALDNEHFVHLDANDLNGLLNSSSKIMLRAQMNHASGSSITTVVPLEFGPGHVTLPSLRLEYEIQPPATVPEPTSLVLLGSALLPLARRLRRGRETARP